MKVENLCKNCMREKAQTDSRCEHCGFFAEQPIQEHHLPIFSILNGKYLVGKAIGEGGFGITYIGMDLNLEMRVAIKEYYPSGCATRDLSGNGMVHAYTGDKKDAFDVGREKFINEARTLAKCNSFPEIVGVQDFFKENMTAYIVMEYIDGMTLKEYLKSRGGCITAEETLNKMNSVIESLGEVHRLGVIHRDISPDNIMITHNRHIKVLDFGGAREYVTLGDQSLSIVVKHGYSPPEQYGSQGKQGPWTDVYALCATMYHCITGQIPPDAMDRIYQDTLEPIRKFQPQISPEVESALLRGLNVHREKRIQNMDELYKELFLTTAPNADTNINPSPNTSPQTWKVFLLIIMGTCLAIIVFFGAIFVLNGRNKATEARADTETAYEGKMIDKTPKDMEEEVQAFETETETEARSEVNGNSIIEVLYTRLEEQIEEYQGTISIYVQDLYTGQRVEINADAKQKAASLIKLYVLASVYDQIDTGNLQETAEVDELLRKMITVSDNESTNELVRRLSDSKVDWFEGSEVTNHYIRTNGYVDTEMNRDVQDMRTEPAPGENYTSTKDCGKILEQIYRGTCVNSVYSEKMYSLLKQQERRSKIPQGIDSAVSVANKTGELNDTQNDAAIVQLDETHAYILCVMIGDVYDEINAVENIAAMSRTVYEYFMEN